VWNETIFWSINSVIENSMNIENSFYNYLVSTHPNFVLLYYLCACFLISIFILKLGNMLEVVVERDMNNKHTSKVPSTLRWQKSAHKNKLQGNVRKIVA